MKPESQRKGLAHRFAEQLKRGPTPVHRFGRRVDPVAQQQQLHESLNELQEKLDTKFSAIDAKLTAAERARGIVPKKPKQSGGRLAPQTMGEGEASIEELLDAFGGAEAIRFHKCGYTMEAARYEHRQMQRRTPSERRLVRI